MIRPSDFADFSSSFLFNNQLLTFNIGSAEFRNVELPTTNIPVLSIAPLWDDFFLTGGSYQGVFYQLGPNNQSVIFEYRLRRAGVPESLYQFQLLYDLASPGVVVFRYFATAETGGMSTIGIQGCEFLHFLLHVPLVFYSQITRPSIHL